MVKNPSKLYKYCSFDTEGNFLKGLKANTIFFSDPKNFNDPFDSKPELIHISINKGLETTQTIDRLFRFAPSDIQEDVMALTGEQSRNQIAGVYKRIINQEYSKIGVTSFSKNFDNNVMWYYYADKHKGFVLEFDAHSDFFKRKFPVNYSNKFPVIRGNDLGVDGSTHSLASKIFFNKSPEWKHEAEWRLMTEGVRKSLSYSPRVLMGIYFGKDCCDQNELLLRSKLDIDMHSHVRFRKMKIKDFSFKLKPVELNNL